MVGSRRGIGWAGREWWWIAWLLLTGCRVFGPPGESDAQGSPDARTADAGPADAMPVDAMPADAAPPAAGPSCSGLAATCGAWASGDCCASARVPGGLYYRSYDAAPDDYNITSNPATISEFWLDTHEVTVGRFRKFVAAGMGTQANPPEAGSGAHAAIAQSGWQASWNSYLAADTAALMAAIKCQGTYQTWTDVAFVNENKPMNCISWYDAFAFCIWDGGYLPTEAEWNYAAAGGDEHRAYPWSDPASSTGIDCTYANYRIGGPTGGFCVNGTTGGVNRVGSESNKGDGRWGHADLAGNVWEWTLDWYSSPYPNPCNDCAQVTTGTQRVLRGGAFYDTPAALRPGFRLIDTPVLRYDGFGVRCARAP